MKLLKTTNTSKPKFCKACFKEIKINTLHQLFFKDIDLCSDCLNLLKPNIKSSKINGVKGYFLYDYNDAIREKIYKLKGCNDIEMSSVFLDYYKHYFKLLFDEYSLICAPSSEEHIASRGFKHIEEIYKSLGKPFIPYIYKTSNVKQSDLSSNERKNIGNHLLANNKIDISNLKILFVDDVYTTGSTFNACINLIKGGHPKKIRFLIISKTIDLDKRENE